MESKSSQQGDNMVTPKSASGDTVWGADSESSQTGGFSVGFSLTVIQVEFRYCVVFPVVFLHLLLFVFAEFVLHSNL